MLKLITPKGTPITHYQEWTRPKKKYQWKAGRSAMELARSWFRHGQAEPPDELLSLLRSSTRLHNIQINTGIPELVTPLPERGEGRNHDLALIAHTPTEQVTITIEAKADEPFGSDTILEYYTKAIKKRDSGTPTRVPERIEQLMALVAPGVSIYKSQWGEVRYQLLTALCGTILQAQADDSTLAILVVHEFQSDETNREKQAENHKEFELLTSLLLGNYLKMQPGKLYDGIQVDGKEVMVGKITTVLASED